jgi:DNA-nicking Smr family endonuclease
VIDIHGLKVVEARHRVDRMLADAILAHARRLRIITGRGKHSKDGIPILKRSIIESMEEYVTLSPQIFLKI